MNKFHFRGFISILLSLAFFVVVATGLVLWLSHSPQTFGLSKGVWKHSHIFLSLLMLIAGVIHFWLNWAVYWRYLWDGTAKRLNQKREFGLALILVALIAGTAAFDQHGGIGPFAGMSVEQIASRSGQNVDNLVAGLKKEGVTVHNPADSLREVAEHNKISAEKLFAIVQRQVPELMRRPPHD